MFKPVVLVVRVVYFINSLRAAIFGHGMRRDSPTKIFRRPPMWSLHLSYDRCLPGLQSGANTTCTQNMSTTFRCVEFFACSPTDGSNLFPNGLHEKGGHAVGRCPVRCPTGLVAGLLAQFVDRCPVPHVHVRSTLDTYLVCMFSSIGVPVEVILVGR